ncbi:MAG: hypothetical protein AB7T06_11020 [Kofleriaceae bacterium]
MGAAKAALIALVLALVAPHAHAERCTGVTDAGSRFVTCFDLGNRLTVNAGTEGVGGAISLRHVVTFDDEPDLIWKLEHRITDTTHALLTNAFDGTIYRGRYIRHARDGHIVLPLGTPKKIFLPFDIGALAEFGALRWRDDASPVEVGMVKVGALIDFSRTRTFRRRFSIGPVSRWDVRLERDPDGDLMPRLAVDEHVVAPFTTGMLELAFESLEGRTAGVFRIEAGTVWSTRHGWQPEARAEAELERIVIAINDRPVSLVLGARYQTRPDADAEATARIGARIVLFDRRDARVNLRPLAPTR